MNQGIKLPTMLVIADNPSIRQWIKKNLEGEFYIIEADNQVLALQIVESTKLDFIILDSHFEEMNPLDLSKQLRQKTTTTPILLITGRLKKIFRDAALASGVTDFLNDQLSIEELETRIATGRQTAQARKKTTELSSVIKERAQPHVKEYFKNKMLLNEKAMRLLSDVKHAEPITLLLLRIDQFEKLQETVGLIEADHLVPHLYDCLSYVLRADDLLIPASNDSFIILLPRTPIEIGRKIAEELRRAVQKEPFKLENQSIHLTISIAISQLEASQEEYKRMVSYASHTLSQAQTAVNLIISLEKESHQ
jgi:diguanylate cyclase (GGDEF)-like protein